MIHIVVYYSKYLFRTKIMKKYIANIISLTRPFIALSLFFFINNKVMFLVMYSLCWFTDLIDGPIARKTKSTSDFGSKLDDLGDYTTILVAVVIFAIWIKNEMVTFLPFLAAIAAIRISNLFITNRKFGKIYIIHTYLNKFTAWTVYVTPVIYLLNNNMVMLYVVMIVAIIASLEEMIIHLITSTYDSNNKSLIKIFYKRANKSA